MSAAAAALCALLAALVLPTSTPAQSDSKKILEFDSWPGKGGALKPGLNFVPSSVPALAALAIRSDQYREVRGRRPESLLRQVDLKKDDDHLRIQIEVFQQATDDAQEALVGVVAARAAPLELIKRGDRQGIALGDVSYITGVVRVFSLDFARNNIRVHVGCLSTETKVDVVAVAKAIDGQIVAQPDFTKETLKRERPAISAFTSASAKLASRERTPLTLTATEPQGRPLKYLFNYESLIKRDFNVTPPDLTFRAPEEAGDYTIEVLAYNPNLLFDTARVAVTVAP